MSVAAQNPYLYARDVERVVDAILDRMARALSDDDRAELRGFGASSTRTIGTRIGRNPRSGTRVHVEAKTAVHFALSKLPKARLNRGKLEPQDEAERLLSVS